MNIYIVSSRLCDGGAERVAVTLANGLTEKGHHVTLVSNLFLPKTYSVGEKVVVRNLVRRNKGKIGKWLGAVRLMRGYLKQDKPDVVIGVMSLCAVVARIAALGMNIPVVMTEHDAFERPLSAPFSKMEYFSKFYLNHIFKYITVLTEADNAIVGHRFKNVVVMPNPLSLQPLSNVPEKKKYILAAGRLDDWHYKGFDNLLKAWSRIEKHYPDWTLQIAGKAGLFHPEREKYLHEITTLLTLQERVIFLGYRTDIDNLFREAAIFVLSSRYEGFGLVLIEAMSQGCACIACDYKGRQKEIVRNEREGIVCKPDDNVEELADGLSRLIQDGQLRAEIQENAIKRSEYYSMELTINRWEKYLGYILSQ